MQLVNNQHLIGQFQPSYISIAFKQYFKYFKWERLLRLSSTGNQLVIQTNDNNKKNEQNIRLETKSGRISLRKSMVKYDGT